MTAADRARGRRSAGCRASALVVPSRAATAAALRAAWPPCGAGAGGEPETKKTDHPEEEDDQEGRRIATTDMTALKKSSAVLATGAPTPAWWR